METKRTEEIEIVQTIVTDCEITTTIRKIKEEPVVNGLREALTALAGFGLVGLMLYLGWSAALQMTRTERSPSLMVEVENVRN